MSDYHLISEAFLRDLDYKCKHLIEQQIEVGISENREYTSFFDVRLPTVYFADPNNVLEYDPINVLEHQSISPAEYVLDTYLSTLTDTVLKGLTVSTSEQQGDEIIFCVSGFC